MDRSCIRQMKREPRRSANEMPGSISYPPGREFCEGWHQSGRGLSGSAANQLSGKFARRRGLSLPIKRICIFLWNSSGPKSKTAETVQVLGERRTSGIRKGGRDKNYTRRKKKGISRISQLHTCWPLRSAVYDMQLISVRHSQGDLRVIYWGFLQFRVLKTTWRILPNSRASYAKKWNFTPEIDREKDRILWRHFL